MKLHLLSLTATLTALAGCASTAPRPVPANFDPASCYVRDFDVYFEDSEADLSVEARDAIAAINQALDGCQIEHVRVVGLAGARGPADQNMEVSTQRAEVVGAYLARTTHWPRGVYDLRAAGEEGAMTEDGPMPMRRRAHITVTASAPPSVD